MKALNLFLLFGIATGLTITFDLLFLKRPRLRRALTSKEKSIELFNEWVEKTAELP